MLVLPGSLPLMCIREVAPLPRMILRAGAACRRTLLREKVPIMPSFHAALSILTLG